MVREDLGLAGLVLSFPEVVCPGVGGLRPGEGGELFRLERSAQRPFQGSLISEGGAQV